MGKAIWDGFEFIFIIVLGVIKKVFYYLICSLFGFYFLNIITLGEYPSENAELDKGFCLIGIIIFMLFMYLTYIYFNIKDKL